MSLQMLYQNFSSTCLIKISHQNFSSKFLVQIPHKNFSPQGIMSPTHSYSAKLQKVQFENHLDGLQSKI